jgi:DNA (cytosine-5)-methyltransferase 3A
MNVLSLFDGISCGQLALERAGIKVDKYYASELDKYPIKITQKNYPDTIQLGDVCNVKSNDLPKIDLLIGGSPCFAKGTKVITSDSYKNIEDVNIGDNVITHNNRFKKVLKTGNSKKQTYIVKAQGMYDTETTANHPYYTRTMTRKWFNEDRTSKRCFSEPSWVKVKDLKKNHFIGIPIIDKEHNPRNLTLEDCWLIGRYLADGHYRKDKRKNRKNSYHYQVVYSIGSTKVDDFKKHVKRPFSCFMHTKSVHRCIVNSKSFVELIESLNLGKGAINKILPIELLYLPNILLKQIIKGYLAGDGSTRGNTYRATSVSKLLIQTLSLAITKVYKVNTSVGFTKRNNTTIIEGRTVNQRDTYSLEFRKNMQKQSRAVVLDNIIWLPVKDVIKTNYTKVVYNLEVADDNSYTANSVIVHNCQGFSFAGKQLNFDDPRSKLFFEYVRLLKETKPKYFLLENVRMKQEYQDVISEYLGVKPIAINSSLVSAQNRYRLYWTNIPNVTQPKDKGVLLKDILLKELKTCRIGGRIVGRRLDELGKRQDYSNIPISQYLEIRNDNKSNCLTTVQKDTVISYIKTDKRIKIKLNQNKASCLTGGAHSGGNHSDMDILVIDPDICRRYSVIECERLQTLPDNYTEGVSNSQRYKALGNGWTVDVISHIFKGLKQ